MLYPLKFNKIIKERLWGNESWEISDLEDNISMVTNGFLVENDLTDLIETYMGELVGESIFDECGLGFPLLIKRITATQDLSVQVHPDDELAGKVYNLNGKSEIWYVIHADENAGAYIGFSKKNSLEEYKESVENDTLVSTLQFYPAKNGDLFFVPAGTVHALGKGIKVAEIQQPSDITFRIFDWNRVDENGNARELHLKEAECAIHFDDEDTFKIEYAPKFNTTTQLFRSHYFNINLLNFDEPFHKNYAEIDSFVIYMCTQGEVHLFGNDFHEVIYEGETSLIPASIKDLDLIPNKKSSLLEIYI